MDLLDRLEPVQRNLLPMDGVVHYYGQVLTAGEADEFLTRLLDDVAWRHDETVYFGKKNITKRKVAWYADEPFSYTYSNTTKTALPWLPVLQVLKAVAERESGETYNSCLLNLYHDGNEGMAWHSDAERDLKKNGAIGSMSFGAERRFLLKHKKSGETVAQQLGHGSLLVMKDVTQSHWRHSIPKTKTVTTARVNLTFRTIDKDAA